MKKIILSILLCLLQISVCYGQIQKTKALSVGDNMPDIELKNIINYTVGTAKISDFDGKLLILDFWATWCSPCIAAFPKLELLSSKFKGKLQILGITEEDKEIVSKFYEKMKKVKQISLPPSITNDKKLSRLFFHATVPHYVWINEKGRVIAITGSEAINEENILAYFQSGLFDYNLKEEASGYPVGIPKFTQNILLEKVDGNREVKIVDTSRLTIHSVLTKYIEGIPSIGQFAPEDYVYRGNTSIKNLYKTALYGGGFRMINSSPSIVIVDITDSTLYSQITGETLSGNLLTRGRLESLAWLKENGYCYELKVPSYLVSQKYKIMLNQLNLYFGAVHGIEGRIEKRMNKYLALIRTSKENRMKSEGNEEKIEQNSFYLKMQNSTIRRLVNRLVLPLQLYPMIEDETGYDARINLELSCRLSDLKALNKELGKYDLQIIEKEKMMNVGIIAKMKL